MVLIPGGCPLKVSRLFKNVGEVRHIVFDAATLKRLLRNYSIMEIVAVNVLVTQIYLHNSQRNQENSLQTNAYPLYSHTTYLSIFQTMILKPMRLLRR